MGFPIKNGVNTDEVTVTNHQLKVQTETDVDTNPSNVGAVKTYSENDTGSILGTPYLYSPETDDDAKLRVSQESIVDFELFNYTAQNTGKHVYATSTLTTTWTTAGLTTNGGNVTTTGTGTAFGTYAEFSIYGATQFYNEMEVSFTNQPVTNFVIDFGMFRRGSATAYAPSDGVYFRLSSAGLQGVINYNGTETTTSVFPISSTNSSPFTYVNNTKYQFIIVINQREVGFWINNQRYGTLDTPSGNGQVFLSGSLPFSVRQAHTGTTSAVINAVFTSYTVSYGGLNFVKSLSDMSSAILGSYQGISGGTMGQLIAGTVTSGTLVKPTAAVPANTSLVANLPNSLGGRIYEQLTTGLAANTDAIFASYTVPSGTTAVLGKRLRVTGIKLSGMVSTVVVGGPSYTEWYIVFGTTADSLATTEAATTKAPRRVMLPELTTNMGAAAAAGTLLVQPQYFAKFDNPIYVNPGERIQLVGNKTITTAITSGVLSFTYQFDYSWE